MLEYSSSQFAPDLLAQGIDASIYVKERLPDSALVVLKLGTMFSVLCVSHVSLHIADTLANCRLGAASHGKACSAIRFDANRSFHAK